METKLKSIMEEHKISATQIAEKMGCSRQRVSDYMKAEEFRKDTAERIAQAVFELSGFIVMWWELYK